MATFKHDPAPFMDPAGKVHAPEDGSIFRPPAETPPTPDKIKPFRKSHYAQLGKTGLHHGIARDARPPEEMTFGKRNDYGSTAEKCLKSATATGMAAVANDNAERIYASHKKEPLGRGPIGHALPEHTQRSTFAFGLPGKYSESVHSVMYAGSNLEQPKTHIVGTAKHRNYDWARVNIDPEQHRFGGGNVGVSDGNGAKSLVDGGCKPTKLIPLPVANAEAVSGKQLGQVKNQGFGSRAQGNKECYGKGGKPEPFGVRALLSGCGEKPDLDDPTLGRPTCKSATLRKLRSAQETAESVNRTFGVPTIRTDLPKPKHRKVTNQNNYGDDASAANLLSGTDFDLPPRANTCEPK